MVKQKRAHRSGNRLANLHLAIVNRDAIDKAVISMSQRERGGYRHMEKVADAKLTIAEAAMTCERARTQGEALVQIALALTELRSAVEGTDNGQPVEIDQGAARIAINCLWSAFSFLGGHDSQAFPAAVAAYYAPREQSPFAGKKGGAA